MEKINITCRLDAEVVHFLDDLAEGMERDRSYLIKQAVSDYVEMQRWQQAEIAQSMKEADARLFASDAEVVAAFNDLRS